MTDTYWPSVHLEQYRSIPKLIAKAYDPDTGDEVLNHLLDRDEMQYEVALEADLQQADAALVDALVAAEARWRERIEQWAVQCGFDMEPWWVSIWQRVKRGDAP